MKYQLLSRVTYRSGNLRREPDFQQLVTTFHCERSARPACHACHACHERSVVERSAGKAIPSPIWGLLRHLR